MVLEIINKMAKNQKSSLIVWNTVHETILGLPVEHLHSTQSPINPLTTANECTRHATLATCYQLAQSVLKISFALAKNVG